MTRASGAGTLRRRRRSRHATIRLRLRVARAPERTASGRSRFAAATRSGFAIAIVTPLARESPHPAARVRGRARDRPFRIRGSRRSERDRGRSRDRWRPRYAGPARRAHQPGREVRREKTKRLGTQRMKMEETRPVRVRRYSSTVNTGSSSSQRIAANRTTAISTIPVSPAVCRTTPTASSARYAAIPRITVLA